jgi:hypothetical protein
LESISRRRNLSRATRSTALTFVREVAAPKQR